MALEELIAVARGDAPGDLLLADARIVNVFTSEIEEGDVVLFEGASPASDAATTRGGRWTWEAPTCCRASSTATPTSRAPCSASDSTRGRWWPTARLPWSPTCTSWPTWPAFGPCAASCATPPAPTGARPGACRSTSSSWRRPACRPPAWRRPAPPSSRRTSPAPYAGRTRWAWASS